MASGKVIVKDRGLAAIQKVMRTGVGDLRVGVQGKEAAKRHPDSKLTNGQLMAVHEFGAPAANIPQRPAIRRSFAKRRKDYEKALRAVSKAVYGVNGKGDSNRKKALRQLKLIGNEIAADIKANIKADNLRFKRIKPKSLAARKVNKRPNPLQDTSWLLNAITAHVTPTRNG